MRLIQLPGSVYYFLFYSYVLFYSVAGTGKSHVTRQIVQQAREQRRLEVGICAPTGVAAVNLNLGAQTVHSLAGIRVPQRYRDFATMFGKINVRKWNKLDMLVIDEVGMLTADFIDWLDCTVRQVRKVPHEVFGGIQMILVGDFAQLGPVPGAISMANQRAYPPHEEGADCFLDVKECTAYAFQSVMWREASFVHVHLKKVYRQSDDFFIHALRDLRESRSNSELVARLVQTCSAPLEEREDLEIPEGIRPTVLYCTNAKVDQKNFDELRSLQTEYKRFDASDTVEVDSEVPLHFRDSAVEKLNRDKFFDQCQATKALDLKVGAQVMLLQNFLDDGLVNGSRGVIDSFKLVPVAKAIASDKTALLSPDDRDKYPGYEWKDLKYGMIVEFDGQKWKIFKFVKYPLVRFMNNKTKIITPTIFERTLYRVGTVKRLQCPLRLAWALTIHKSQGSSLDLVVCDLRGCFTTGQAYVALSRAKTMPGLQIVNFDPSCVKTDPLVEEFYKAMDGSRQDMQNFLIHRAGLWWYPILDCPAWLSMFQNASKNKYAKQASRIFREWMVNYPPIDGYSGWRGYTDGTTGLQVIDPRGSAPSLQSSAMAPSEFYQTHLGISSSQRSGASSGTPQVARPYKPTKVLQPLPTQSNTQASATPPPAATSKSNISPHPPVSTRPPTSANSFGHPKNTAIVEAFQELSGHYDRERNGNAANTYRKVSNAIKGVQFEITADNAKKLGIGKNKIEGIGKASAERIYEFVTSGKIAKLEEKRAWAQAERG
jgi:ATP-dependent DNA helicase PIF1